MLRSDLLPNGRKTRERWAARNTDRPHALVDGTRTAWMKQKRVTRAVGGEDPVARPRVSDVAIHQVKKFAIGVLAPILGSIGKQVRFAMR